MSSFRSRLFACISAASLSLLVTGCGLGVSAPAPLEAGALRGFSGVVHGGSQPIIGATVNLYVTVAGAGYGGTAQNLAHTTTGSYGQFSFPAGAYTYSGVDSTQYAYMTVVGGNAGTSGANSNILLMAALGSASSLTTQTSAQAVQVYISEASTVAAAYALSNFITDTSGVVNVAASSTNSATSAACSFGYSMTCTASGLGHAFANAANLVPAAGTNALPTAGLANSTLPTNANASVPQALINYLANALTACTNSTGGVATNTATPCGKLFAATTPPGTMNYPTDTLQAAINMAKYPTNNVSAIAAIPAPSAPFQPSLSSAPTDLSMAIVYSISPAAGTTTAPYYLALDAQDNVFVAVKDSTPSSGVAGLSSSGTLLFPYTQNNSTVYVTPFALATDSIGHVWLTDTSTLSSNTPGPYGGVLRGFYTGTVTGTTAGNVYTSLNGVANAIGAGNNPAVNSNGTAGATAPVTPALTTSEGNFTGIGIDRANGIWACKNGGNGNFRFSFTAGSSGVSPDTYTDLDTTVAGATGKGPTSTAYAKNFSVGCTNAQFDNFQDLYQAGGIQTGGQAGLFPNLGAAATPAYGTQNVKNSAVNTSIGSATGAGPAGSTTGESNSWITGGEAVAQSTSSVSGTTTTTAGITYLPGPAGIYSVTESSAYNTTGPVLTQTATVSTGPVITGTITPESYPEFDGAGVIWIPSNSASGNIQYGVPGTVATPTAAITLAPCYLPAAATACASSSAGSYANVLQVDSTGSVWTISQNNGGVITQIIGTAAPTWPGIFYATYGSKP